MFLKEEKYDKENWCDRDCYDADINLEGKGEKLNFDYVLIKSDKS